MYSVKLHGGRINAACYNNIAWMTLQGQIKRLQKMKCLVNIDLYVLTCGRYKECPSDFALTTV